MNKLTQEELGTSLRKILGKHSENMIKISNENIGKGMEELLEALKEEDQAMAVEFTSEILKQLSRMGVDLSSVWKILDREDLVRWAD